MQVGETVENYLETILILLEEKKEIRSVDIANEMGYSRPTISVMMRQLREDGYILVDDRGYITLTERGWAIAAEIYERHKLLTEILIKLGVSEQVAHEDACKMEHHISRETFSRIKDYYLNR